MNQRIIFHIDFDSFFASVEQQYNPQFRGKPLGVTAHNGRTAIIAASREAKKMGVKGTMRTYDAYRLCPQLLLTRADFNKYWEVSKKFLNICKDYSPFVEVFSIDELFMDVTLTTKLFGGVEVLIKKIKERVRTEVGEYITVSVGVSYNKLLAKLGSGMNKPDGMAIITPENLYDIYQKVALIDFCGIGERILTRLNMMGIYTPMHLLKAPLASLIAEFGNVEGHFLYNLARGVDNGLVKSFSHTEEAKSVGRNYCLPRNEYDRRIVFQNLYELCEEVALKLRRLHMKARIVGFSFSGTFQLGGHLTRLPYLDSGKELFDTCLSILQRNPDYDEFRYHGYVRQIRVFASDLKDAFTLPRSLFPEKRRRERLIKAVDRINERFGDHTIRNAFLLYAKKLTTVPNGFMGDRYERQLLTSFPLENPEKVIRQQFFE